MEKLKQPEKENYQLNREYLNLLIIQTSHILYDKGFNVFPVPSPDEMVAMSKINPKLDYYSKPPYILNPLFIRRLHRCGDGCQRYQKTKVLCNDNGSSFDSLFVDPVTGYGSNLAVMLGQTSGNLMAFDCDTQPAFEKMLEIISFRKIQNYSYSSFRGGGILIRLLEGAAVNSKISKIDGVEIYGNRHFMVLPPSRHPRGVEYKWINPKLMTSEIPEIDPISVRQIADLGIEITRHNYTLPIIVPENYPEWHKQLSRKNLQFLLEGASYHERNNRLFSAACDCAAIGIPSDETEEFLLRACKKCQPPLSVSEARQTIESAFSKVRAPAKSYQNISVIEKAEELCRNFHWQDFGGSWRSVRTVYQAMIQRSKWENKNEFRCSIREMSMLSGLGKNTVLSAMSQLRKGSNAIGNAMLIPFVFVVSTNKSNHANYYKFNEVAFNCAELGQNIFLVNTVPKPHINFPRDTVEKDIFKLLGISGWQVWQYLKVQPAKNHAEIAEALGISRWAVTHALKPNGKLLKFGFIKLGTLPERYIGVEIDGDQLVNIAKISGAVGKTQIKMDKFNVDREIYVNRCIARAKIPYIRASYYYDKKSIDNSC